MQYAILIYDDESALAGMSARERELFLRRYGKYTQELVADGHMRGGAQLHPPSTAATIRGADRPAEPGPFAADVRKLDGYYVVECADLDEALALARRVPSLEVGGAVEVRPLVPPRAPAGA